MDKEFYSQFQLAFEESESYNIYGRESLGLQEEDSTGLHTSGPEARVRMFSDPTVQPGEGAL